ncbi:MAG: zinc finger domain-containing protein [Candidatus Micrarchaeota archaeon]
MKTCTSCGRTTEDYTMFPCPGCSKAKITRCKDCKENINRFACPDCGYEGP